MKKKKFAQKKLSELFWLFFCRLLRKTKTHWPRKTEKLGLRWPPTETFFAGIGDEEIFILLLR